MKINYNDYLLSRKNITTVDILISYDLDVSNKYCGLRKFKTWKVSRNCTSSRYIKRNF